MGLTKTCHFYVVIPPEDTAISQDASQAVSSTQELAAIMKRNPHARFQSANSPEEAMQKALEKIQFSRDTESLCSPSPRAERRRGRSSLSAVEGSLGAPATPSPKTDELLMMGREIITKQDDKVLERIEKNPRILCTESEFPTILQEGCKLNAMHLAAKSSNHVVMKHILNCASSMDFMRRIYPSQSEERLKSCSKHLASCYLNTPDKMFQETPLHFACKFNAVECVQLLLSHPFCDTKLKNYEHKTAVELIGQRDDVNNAKAKAIRNLIEQRFIVPIWRNTSVDGDAPVLGEASCIRDLGQAIPPPLLSSKFPDFSLSLLEPCATKLLPKESQSNLKLFSSQTAVWKIMAFAGPMAEKKAKEFRNVMKHSRFFLFGNASPDSSSLNISVNNDLGEYISPPSTPPCRSPNQGLCTPPPSSQLLLSPISSPISRRSLCNSPVRNCSPLKTDIAARVRDVEKGLERIAFEYAHDMGIPWLEHWKFLGKFSDLSSEEGLQLLEDYLRTLESTKHAFSNEEHENSDGLRNSTMDEVIERLENIRLSNSGLASPEGRSGFCTNPKCRMESRFCNCDSVVPMIPYISKHDFMDDWEYGDIDAKDFLPFSGGSQPFIGIRKLNSSANTDSFEVSTNNSVDADFQWPGPCPFNDVFSTAPSSPVENDVFEDCLAGAPVYFNGNEPGKLDYQVFQVLKDCSDNLDRNKFLTTFQWFNSMQAYGNALAATTQRTMANGTPKRLWGPSFVSTPGREDKSFDTSF